MQQWFPEMGRRLVDQRHVRDVAPTERVAKARNQLQASGTAANYDDAMRATFAACHIDYHLALSTNGTSAELVPFASVAGLLNRLANRSMPTLWRKV
jgi:hypothetical protein